MAAGALRLQASVCACQGGCIGRAEELSTSLPTRQLNKPRQLNVPFDGCLAEPESLSLLIKGLFPKVAQAALRTAACEVQEPFTFN